MQFKYPLFFLCFLLYLPLVWRYIHSVRAPRTTLRLPQLETMRTLRVSFRRRLRHLPFILQMAGIGLLIVALARPQKGHTSKTVSTEGVDIVLVMDASSSMRSLDFKPKNRLHVAKSVVKEFVKKRSHDRIGLVVFAARAFTKCPLTLDYDIITRFIDDIEFGDIEDGTAIGTAIATAGNRLRESKAKSRVMILLTDGESNMGEISPQVAARAVKQIGVKIYTVGIGKEGKVPMPVQVVHPFTGEVVGEDVRMVKSQLDEATLREIAQITDGRFFRAQNPEKLQQIYATIDTLEKTEIKTKTFTSFSDRFFAWLVWGFLLICSAFILQRTWIRTAP